MRFPVSGVECPIWLPPLVSFVISSMTAGAGISGAFLLLPFQVSVLGFSSPSVSPTNLIYNITAIPGGTYRYIKEGRMAWPLTWTIILGTLPGFFIGAIIRIKYLPDARSFKLFMGFVLLYLGGRLIYELIKKPGMQNEKNSVLEKKFRDRAAAQKEKGKYFGAGLPSDAIVKTKKISARVIEYEFWGETFSISPAAISVLSLSVGLIGGIYGIGGGAIIAPFVVSILRLPVYTVAGAALAGTFITSIAGVIYFELLALTSFGGQAAIRPDWTLGALFGLGGLIGTYVGARIQKYMPARLIQVFLGILVTGLAVSYIFAGL